MNLILTLLYTHLLVLTLDDNGHNVTIIIIMVNCSKSNVHVATRILFLFFVPPIKNMFLHLCTLIIAPFLSIGVEIHATMHNTLSETLIRLCQLSIWQTKNITSNTNAVAGLDSEQRWERRGRGEREERRERSGGTWGGKGHWYR